MINYELPVIYKNNQMQLTNQGISEGVEAELFDVFELNKACLYLLKSKRYYYNYEVSLYRISRNLVVELVIKVLKH